MLKKLEKRRLAKEMEIKKKLEQEKNHLNNAPSSNTEYKHFVYNPNNDSVKVEKTKVKKKRKKRKKNKNKNKK